MVSISRVFSPGSVGHIIGVFCLTDILAVPAHRRKSLSGIDLRSYLTNQNALV